jgi:hypothetical protein
MSADDQIRAMRAILDAVEEAVRAAGSLGAPAGPLYMSLASLLGCTLSQFEMIMRALVTAGRVRQESHLYFSAR